MGSTDLINDAIDATLIALADEYITWKGKLHKEMRDGKLMFDAPKHYKWLTEDELLIYYMDIGRFIEE